MNVVWWMMDDMVLMTSINRVQRSSTAAVQVRVAGCDVAVTLRLPTDGFHVKFSRSKSEEGARSDGPQPDTAAPFTTHHELCKRSADPAPQTTRKPPKKNPIEFNQIWVSLILIELTANGLRHNDHRSMINDIFFFFFQGENCPICWISLTQLTKFRGGRHRDNGGRWRVVRRFGMGRWLKLLTSLDLTLNLGRNCVCKWAAICRPSGNAALFSTRRCSIKSRQQSNNEKWIRGDVFNLILRLNSWDVFYDQTADLVATNSSSIPRQEPQFHFVKKFVKSTVATLWVQSTSESTLKYAKPKSTFK